MKVPGLGGINDSFGTTAEEDLAIRTRLIVNLIWEFTKAIITISIILANILVAVRNGTESHHPHILSNSLFLVMGFYLAQTRFDVRKSNQSNNRDEE